MHGGGEKKDALFFFTRRLAGILLKRRDAQKNTVKGAIQPPLTSQVHSHGAFFGEL